jgi:hypothetical protein
MATTLNPANQASTPTPFCCHPFVVIPEGDLRLVLRLPVRNNHIHAK